MPLRSHLLVALVALVALAALAALAACEGEPCRADAECPAGQRCGGGLCVPLLAEGAACAADAECLGRLCLDAGQGATCRTACEQRSDCAKDQRCAPLAGHAPGAAGMRLALVCAPPRGERLLGEACAAAAECDGGLCQQGRCSEPCREACPAPLTCQDGALAEGSLTLQHRSCVRRWVELLELGPVATPVAGGAPVELALPPGVTSLVVFADDSDDLQVGFRRIEGPGGAVLYDGADPKSALARPFFYIGTGSVLLPGSDAAGAALQPGTYRFWPQTYELRFDQLVPQAGTVERVAAVLRRDGPAGGLLDLAVHLAPGTGLSAKAAPTDAYVKDLVSKLGELGRGLFGFSLGSVRFLDLPASADTVTTSDQARELREGYSQAGPRGLDVNVLLSKDLTFGYKAVAGGIPGVPGLVGRPASGIVAEKQPTGAQMGKLLAHELGHYLGLYHTTEADGSVDLLSDTPFCGAGVQVEACPDRQNLMFPQYLLSPEPLSLSEGQRRLAQGSPWLYQEVYPLGCGELSVVDVSASRWAVGTLAGSSRLGGACGGGAGAEQVHLLRLAEGVKSLRVTVRASGFTPVLYLRRGPCTAAAAELRCAAGKDGEALTVDAGEQAAGTLFLVVDAAQGSGAFTLTVE